MGCVLSGFINIARRNSFGKSLSFPGNFEVPGLRRELFRIIIESMRIKNFFRAGGLEIILVTSVIKLGVRDEPISELFGNLG